MKKLIKLSDSHYIVVDESKPVEDGYRITHSTQIAEHSKLISLTEVEELVNGYSVDSICEKEFNIKYPSDETNWKKSLWKDGFKVHQELTKDKLFTESELLLLLDRIARRYFKQGQEHKGNMAIAGDPLFGLRNELKEFIKSLLPKNEWLVDFDENGKLKLV